MYSRTPHTMVTSGFDIDTVDNMIYYFDDDDSNIKRAFIDNTTTQTLYTHDGLDVWDIAVDWMGRY